MQATRRRSTYLPLAQMFAAWALIVAWLQLQALNAAEMATPEVASDTVAPAPETPADAVAEAVPDEAAETPADAVATEVQVADLAVPPGETEAVPPSQSVQASGASGMLTEPAGPGLDVAVGEAQPLTITFDAARELVALQPTAIPTSAAPVASPPQTGDEEEYVPPTDGWIWETDETGNILARIDSPQVQVRLGTTPVNIWGGLSVQDPDSPETFRPLDGVQGQWGALTLYEDGSWNYVETSDHAPYEPGLSNETFTVQSFDGTAAQVVIWLRYDNIGDLLAG